MCIRDRPGPEPPSFHENAQPRGSKVLLIQQVKEYLQENYTQRITLNSAAALVYLTPTYLSKLFAEVEGMGFSDYLSALRIQHAKEALLDYHRRIYEIAAQVGYQDVKHLSLIHIYLGPLLRQINGEGPIQGRSFALRNIHEQLCIAYGPRDIHIESRPGAGTRVFFRIPLERREPHV